MTKRRKILLAGLAIVLLALAARAVHYRVYGPSNAGVTLREWLDIYITSKNQARRHEAAEAIRHMRTRAVPVLLKWIQYDPWGRYDDIWLGHPYPQAGFRALGSQGIDAIPTLTRLMNDPKASGGTRHLAIESLAFIGKESLPSLMEVLKNPRATDRDDVVYAVMFLGTNARPAIPLLIQCLDDQENETLVVRAIRSLGALKFEPSLVVPALTKCLTNKETWFRREAAEALSNFGPAAASSVPFLYARFLDPNHDVREAATNALLKIAPETLNRATQKQTNSFVPLSP